MDINSTFILVGPNPNGLIQIQIQKKTNKINSDSDATIRIN